MTNVLRLLVMAHAAFAIGATAAVWFFYSMRVVKTLGGEIAKDPVIDLIKAKISPIFDNDLEADITARAAWLAVQEMTGRRGLLPFHVAMISFSYLLSMMMVTIELFTRIGADAGPSWRIPAGFLSFITGDIALIGVLVYEKRRVR